MKSKGWLLIIIYMAILFAGIGCATTKKDFEKASQINKIYAYEEFLKNHPRGELSEEAKKKIARLKWREAKATDTIDAYQHYLKTTFEWKDLSEVADLRIKAQNKVETLLYRNTQKADTTDAYVDYLLKFPEGQFSDQARARLEELRYHNAVALDTIQLYKSFISDFPESRRIPSVRARIETLNYNKISYSKSEKVLRKFLEDYPKGNHYEEVWSKLSQVCFQKALKRNTDNAYIDFLMEFSASDMALKAITSLRNYTYKFVTTSWIMAWTQMENIAVRLAGAENKGFPFGIKMSELSKRPELPSHKQYRRDKDIYYFREGFILTFEDWTKISSHICKGQAVITDNGLKFVTGSEIIQPK